MKKRVVAEHVKPESVDIRDTSIAASIRLGELKKSLIRAEFSSLETDHAEKLGRTLVNKEEDPSPSWYFTHA